jgi:hypothetical protein
VRLRSSEATNLKVTLKKIIHDVVRSVPSGGEAGEDEDEDEDLQIGSTNDVCGEPPSLKTVLRVLTSCLFSDRRLKGISATI